MVKVIKHGNEKREITCKECGALLNYVPSDVMRLEYRERLYGACVGEKRYIVCPDCSSNVIISQTK
jgi:DNA-directed RNA polymerase subunit RPC12/RpoP